MAGDFRYAVRSLVRSRTFTIAAVVALALGIGAGTAVFSVVDRILFRSLPYAQSGRLVSVGMLAPIVPEEFLLGYDYFDWRATQTPFEAMGSWNYSLRDCDLNDTRPMRLRCGRADSTLLSTLGIQPIAGRAFTAAEERPNAPPTALISEALWRSRFGADRAAIGRTLRLDGRDVTLAGVLPRDFELPTLDPVDVFLPQVLDEPDQHSRRSAIVLDCVARLKPGVTQAQAAAALRPLFERSMQDVPPAFRKDVKLLVRGLRDRQVQDSRLASWVLLGSVLAVLLIACANAANLLLARAATREREFAVRAALGASRARLIGQSLTESTLLALAGGAAGCVLAFALLRVLLAIAPQGIPRLQQASLDLRVLIFAVLLSIVCALVFGLVLALQTPRMETLAAGRSQTGGRLLFRQFLVAMQICVSMVLLSGAGLLLRSVWNLETQPLGVRTANIVTAAVTLGRTAYPGIPQRAAFFEALEQRLRRIPGTGEVAVADSLPPTGNSMGTMLYAAIEVQGRPHFNEGTGGPVEWRSVTPEYFSVLGIPILQGRAFDEADRSPDHHSVILSERLARRMFPNQDPIGQQIRPGLQGDWVTVVGVAANTHNSGLEEADKPEYYLVRKYAPVSLPPGATALIRTPLPVDSVAKSIRMEIAALDPTLPVKIETLDSRIGQLAARPRFNALVLALFAALGMLLAAIGLYGVISFIVTQRAPEIGVRMALGATPAAVTGMMLRQAAQWTIAGALAGAIGSWFAVRLLSHLLFHVSPEDPRTFAAAIMILFAVALAAAWLPSRRAARLDPMRVLRQE